MLPTPQVGAGIHSHTLSDERVLGSQFLLSSKASFLHIVTDVYTNHQNIQQLKKNNFLKLTLK